LRKKIARVLGRDKGSFLTYAIGKSEREGSNREKEGEILVGGDEPRAIAEKLKRGTAGTYERRIQKGRGGNPDLGRWRGK